MIEKYEFQGEEEGGSLLVLGAVHGNETVGMIAGKKIIEELHSGKIKLKRGKLTIVPICNPEANRQDKRSIEENLNRVMIPHETPVTYEQKLANEICPLIKSHLVLLDLHSTHCEGDVPFAFCDYPNEFNLKIVQNLPVGYVLEGWPQIYAGSTQIQDFSTEWYAHHCGNTGTTLECGYHKAPAAGELAYQAICNTLVGLGMLDAEQTTPISKKHILMKHFVVKERQGSLCLEYKHLDSVSKGEVLARYDDGEELTAPEDGFILLPNHHAELGTEWYYFGVEKSA